MDYPWLYILSLALSVVVFLLMALIFIFRKWYLASKWLMSEKRSEWVRVGLIMVSGFVVSVAGVCFAESRGWDRVVWIFSVEAVLTLLAALSVGIFFFGKWLVLYRKPKWAWVMSMVGLLGSGLFVLVRNIG